MIAVDKDRNAFDYAKPMLEAYTPRFKFFKMSFSQAAINWDQILPNTSLNVAIFDLGLCSTQANHTILDK